MAEIDTDHEISCLAAVQVLHRECVIHLSEIFEESWRRGADSNR